MVDVGNGSCQIPHVCRVADQDVGAIDQATLVGLRWGPGEHHDWMAASQQRSGRGGADEARSEYQDAG
jgi:hypothetical protein